LKKAPTISTGIVKVLLRGITPMSAQENIDIARHFFAEQDRLKGLVPEELVTPDYTAHIVGFPPMDFASHSELNKAFYGGFPDLKQTIDDSLADEGKAALRFTITGTHQYELMGIEPSGREINVAGIAIFHIVDGKVAQLHEIVDHTGMMQQLRPIPDTDDASMGE
jgi:predicted ester cyclase